MQETQEKQGLDPSNVQQAKRIQTHSNQVFVCVYMFGYILLHCRQYLLGHVQITVGVVALHLGPRQSGGIYPTNHHDLQLWSQAKRYITEGISEVKLPTIWTNEKQSRAEAQRWERLEKRRSEKRKSQKKEDADARKGRKVTKQRVFPRQKRKSRLSHAYGASPIVTAVSKSHA